MARQTIQPDAQSSSTPTPAPPMHPLRRRMIEDMTMRGLTLLTQKQYLRAVRMCCKFTGKAAEDLGFDDVRAFQLHMAQSGVSAGTLNGVAIGLRFFFRVTRRMASARDLILLVTPPQRIPPVLTREEVADLIDHAHSLKWRTALCVAYGAGLRASEVVHLKVSDIDSAQMLIKVEQGKRYTDRYAKLSPGLLAQLRDWWRYARPPAFLFPRVRSAPLEPVTARSLSRAFIMAKEAADIRKPATLHTLRHSFATHLLEDGVDIRVIQALLGHKKLDTSAIYVRVTPKKIQSVTGPFEKLKFADRPPR